MLVPSFPHSNSFFKSVKTVSLCSLFSVLSRSVERLDLDKGWWVPVEPMLSRRSTLGVAVLYEELYAVGGFDGTNGLDTVEKYNPSESVSLCTQHTQTHPVSWHMLTLVHLQMHTCLYMHAFTYSALTSHIHTLYPISPGRSTYWNK